MAVASATTLADMETATDSLKRNAARGLAATNVPPIPRLMMVASARTVLARLDTLLLPCHALPADYETIPSILHGLIAAMDRRSIEPEGVVHELRKVRLLVAQKTDDPEVKEKRALFLVHETCKRLIRDVVNYDLGLFAALRNVTR